MSNLCLTGSFLKVLPERKAKQPRERFTRYYRDLHALYKKNISEESFYEGSGYSFVELGTTVLDELHAHGLLQNIDLVVVTYWAHEFDPDHSSCGPFFANKYQLNCQILDVCDQGSISFFTGIHIIENYLKNGTKKALLLALEQTSIPRDKNEHCVMPNKTFAAGFIFEAQENHVCLQLRGCEILLENQIFASHFNGVEYISKLARKYSLEKLRVYSKRTNYFYKNYQFNYQPPHDKSYLEPAVLENGYFPVVYYLNSLINSPYRGEPGGFCIVDEDTETLDTGFLIIQR